MGIKKLPKIEKFEDTPFEINKQKPILDSFYYRAYEDKWPVCDGHLLFVPKKDNEKFISITLSETIKYGNELVEKGEIDSYHFGMNIGEYAGQTVMWPHVHFIPRHEGDCKGFPGSVRLAHRNGRGAAYYLEHEVYGEEYKKIHISHLDDEGFIE